MTHLAEDGKVVELISTCTYVKLDVNKKSTGPAMSGFTPFLAPTFRVKQISIAALSPTNLRA